MALIPANLPLKIYIGITFGPVILRAKDAANQPVDLTGWKVFAEVRKKPGAVLYLDLQPVFSNITIGEITIPKMADEQTYDLVAGNYDWDLILEDPTGDRRGPYIQGPFPIVAIVTKPPEGARE
jgi:hypothetical protein